MTIGTGAGATVSIATTYGTAATISAITNAAEAVATLSAAHGIIVGDYFEVTSGWSKLNGRIVRAKTVSTNDVTLEGIDTSSTTDYPAGTGTGSVREITAWTQISNVKQDSFALSGGEQQFADATPLDSTVQVQFPTIRSPYAIGFSVMDTSAGLTAARAAGSTKTAMRIVSGAGTTVCNGFWTAAEVPNISGTEVNQYSVNFVASALPKTY